MMGFIPFVGVGSQASSEGIFRYFLVQVVGSLMLFMVGLVGRGRWGY